MAAYKVRLRQSGTILGDCTDGEPTANQRLSIRDFPLAIDMSWSTGSTRAAWGVHDVKEKLILRLYPILEC
jgi:hypothetical protein